MGSEADPCWGELADVLLPRRLKELLVAGHGRADHEQFSLTIVPFYYLWRFPFAALRVSTESDVRLIDCANIALTPSSRFLCPRSTPRVDSPREGHAARRALGYLPTLTKESRVELEREALSAAYSFTKADSADDLLTLLGKGDDYDLVTISVHGDDGPTFMPIRYGSPSEGRSHMPSAPPPPESSATMPTTRSSDSSGATTRGRHHRRRRRRPSRRSGSRCWRSGCGVPSWGCRFPRSGRFGWRRSVRTAATGRSGSSVATCSTPRCCCRSSRYWTTSR
jgi:hypothetical protein